MSADLLVVGGGIGGAVLANLLNRGGKEVVVLEKSTTPPNWVRPEVLWPATVEVLFSLSPRQVWETEALLPMRGVDLHDGQRISPVITPELLQEAQVQPWFTNPNQTREQLLRLGDFELRRGVEVIAVLKEKNQIVGVRTRDVTTAEEREVLAHYTVGDDGVHSVVRKACDIEIKTQMFPLDLLCFGFDWPATLPSAIAHIWPNLTRLDSGVLVVAAFPLSNDKGAGLVAVRPRIFDDLAPTQEAWKQFCAIDPAIQDIIQDRQFPHDFMRIRRLWGHAAHYGAAGAILIGDAAHPVSPVGGQGANMSVADACTLAELLIHNPPNLLEKYERRRQAANERSMRFTRAAAVVLGLPEWAFRFLPTPIFPSLARWMGRHPSLLRRAIQSAATAFQEPSN
jgi:2-polyprenyl-6-methoxyphenol hydroxylase-like FAD-dependent oxidoreductase